jgi:uncharacterized protein (DUF2267 family)
MSQQKDPFAAAEQHARDWLSSVARELGTDDRHYAYRALRAWLHLVRDRLGVRAAARLGAQLPELLRGVYVADWVPGQAPHRYRTDEFVAHFSRTADIAQEEAPAVVAAVTAALRDRFSLGQMDHILAQLPRALRRVLSGEPAPDQWPEPLTERVTHLEATVDQLAEAVRTLVIGLENLPVDEPSSGRATAAAHDAHRILLTGAPG